MIYQLKRFSSSQTTKLFFSHLKEKISGLCEDSELNRIYREHEIKFRYLQLEGRYQAIFLFIMFS